MNGFILKNRAYRRLLIDFILYSDGRSSFLSKRTQTGKSNVMMERSLSDDAGAATTPTAKPSSHGVESSCVGRENEVVDGIQLLSSRGVTVL